MIKFQKMFKTKSPISPEVIKEQSLVRNKKMSIPKWRLKIARYRFSFRTRTYWNSIPKDLKMMKLVKFKEELKKHILSNRQKYLNLGLSYNVVGESVVKKKRKKNGQIQKMVATFKRKEV